MRDYLKKIAKNNRFLRKFISKFYYLLKRNSKKIKGKNNIVDYSEAFLSNVKFDIVGTNNKVFIKSWAQLSNVTVFIRGSNHKLVIGNNCKVRGGTLWFEDINCTISIEEKTTIESAHIAVIEPNSRIDIGKDCMISSAVNIVNGDSHSIIDLVTGKRFNYAKDIFIGDHVWLGAQVQVLKGVTIGNDSIAGSRSVITKSVPENSIVAGVPAKVIRSNVTWDRQRIYQ